MTKKKSWRKIYLETCVSACEKCAECTKTKRFARIADRIRLAIALRVDIHRFTTRYFFGQNVTGF